MSIEQLTDRPAAVIVTRAPSELPITLSLRLASSAAFTVSRTSSSRSHAARMAGSFHSSTAGKFLEVDRRRPLSRHMPPEVVRGYRKDRRQQARETVAHHIHGGLGRAPLAASWRRGCTSGPSSRRHRTRSGARSRACSASATPPRSRTRRSRASCVQPLPRTARARTGRPASSFSTGTMSAAGSKS